jgi:archaellum biogenesis ATPase FlaH
LRLFLPRHVATINRPSANETSRTFADGLEVLLIDKTITMADEHYNEDQTVPEFKVWSIGELLEKEFPISGWIIDKLIPTPGLTFIAGKAGKGKSLFTLALAKAVSNATRFGEHFETREGSVLIIDEENQPSEIQKRTKLFQIDAESPLYVMSMQGFQINNKQHIQAVLNEALWYECKVIVIDSLVRTHSLDENQAKEMRQIRAALTPLINEGLAVIIIHHQGKLGADQKEIGMRGSSELDAMAESVIMISKDERTITVKQTKSRQAEAVPAFEMELTGDGEEQLGLVYRGLDSTNKVNVAKEVVLELLEEAGQLNQTEIYNKAKELYDLPIKKVQTALTNLLYSKHIVKTGGAKGALLYSLWGKEES